MKDRDDRPYMQQKTGRQVDTRKGRTRRLVQSIDMGNQTRALEAGKFVRLG